MGRGSEPTASGLADSSLVEPAGRPPNLLIGQGRRTIDAMGSASERMPFARFALRLDRSCRLRVRPGRVQRRRPSPEDQQAKAGADRTAARCPTLPPRA